MLSPLAVSALTPDRATFRALAREGNVIPVVRTVLADTETPVSVFRRFADAPGAFLLESVEGGEKWASHSYIGIDPFCSLVARGAALTLTEGESVQTFEGDPIEALRTLMRRFRPVAIAGLPRFAGGAVGFFGYDTVRFIERLPETAEPGLAMPDACWLFPERLIVFDNLSHRLQLVHFARVAEGDDPEAAYDRAEAELARLGERLGAPFAAPAPRPASGPLALEANMSEDEFVAAVDAVKAHIAAGDIFQLVLSQRFTATTPAPPFEIYRALRLINPSPYMYYLNVPGATIVGASPELLFRVQAGELTVRPIAGTRPRGKTPEEDVALEAALRADPKELAEHVMLIDLGRNDVGRVAALGSVRVVDRMVVERYSHVMHLVSSVCGTLAHGLDAFDAFRAAFPAGTLSGAPKVRAMELIERFEPSRRALYGGAVGYFGFDGGADLAIAIRTLVAQGDAKSFQTGAGIVYDSDARSEYQETLHKAGAVRRALELAHQGLPTLG